MQIQELEPTPSIEITSSFESYLEMNSSSNDGNLPIAIRKGAKKGTQFPLYPLSYFVPYDKLSHTQDLSYFPK